MKWEDVAIGKLGIKCLEFPLSDEPRFGIWRIFVTEKVFTPHLIAAYYMYYSQIDRGSCRYYWQSRSETCNFEVKEFGKDQSNFRHNHFDTIIQFYQGFLWKSLGLTELKEMIPK